MFDQLWEQSQTVQKMREQMREQLTEQLHKQYYEEGIVQGIMQGKTEGEIETLQRRLMDVVRIKFPDLTDLAQKQVKLFDNPGALDLLFDKMLTVPDSKTAQWLLESNSKQ